MAEGESSFRGGRGGGRGYGGRGGFGRGRGGLGGRAPRGRGGFDSQQPRGQLRRNEEELGSRTLQIESKRFYLDLKKNDRGRFFTIAEVSPNGQRRRILLSVSAAQSIHELLDGFIEATKDLPKSDDDSGEPLMTEVLRKDGRRYFLDLKENAQGRFLKVAQTGFMGDRVWVVIPAEGLGEFKSAFKQLFDEHDCSEQAEELEAPDESEHAAVLQSESKTFFFDPGSNQRGDYVKVAEVSQSLYYSGRALILIPGEGVEDFCGAITTLQETCADDEGNFRQESNSLRVENKTFYFDSGSNKRGSFIRISEVQANFRSSITVPAGDCDEFVRMVQRAAEQIDQHITQSNNEDLQE